MLGGLAWAHRNGHTAARATLFRAQLRLYCVLWLLRFAIWFVGVVPFYGVLLLLSLLLFVCFAAAAAAAYNRQHCTS